jgi:hypothetical protein
MSFPQRIFINTTDGTTPMQQAKSAIEALRSIQQAS